MKIKTEKIRKLSSADYINMFLSSKGGIFKYRSKDIQIYDYQQVCKNMKLPTTVFRPVYNYALLLQDGYIVTQVGLEVKRIYAPASLFISAGQIISVQSVSENVAGTLVVIENESLNRIFSETELLKIFNMPAVASLNATQNQIIIDIGRLLLKEHESTDADQQVLTALIKALLFKLLKHSGSNKVTSREHAVANQFKDLVYKSFVTEKGLAYYTEALTISENYLNRCTQSVFATSAKRFILEVSILQSQLLLQDMQSSVAQVAFALNFEDSSYFTRLFKKITGLTPTAYRQGLLSC